MDLGPPVVISPSLSGMYSLPFLTAPGSQVRGYVPVAPICTDKINAADYASVKVPTCESLTCPCQDQGRVLPGCPSSSGDWEADGRLLGELNHQTPPCWFNIRLLCQDGHKSTSLSLGSWPPSLHWASLSLPRIWGDPRERMKSWGGMKPTSRRIRLVW